ncbi:valine--tRNA ligase, mitochondrial-like [Phasianus colchicus]|uniref:valine--tRNA ligase, mitochondrial-like n=1 Tax=Phasianus colchicus TaxID=9054 RepID=UPI00129DD5A4|nr:valine--tRNA ligase, mitochondrial-like [Phasianus colchicus]
MATGSGVSGSKMATGSGNIESFLLSPIVAVRCPAALQDAMLDLSPTLQALAQAGPVELLPQGAGPEVGPEVGPGWVGAPTGTGIHVYICLQDLVDPHSERARLHARTLNLQHRLRALTPRGEDPTSSSPHQRQVCSLRSELALLTLALEALGPPQEEGRPPQDG